MIRSLRQHHRQFFAALGVFLPVAFTVGIAARQAVPVEPELPAALRSATVAFKDDGQSRMDLFAKVPVRVRFLRDGSGSGRIGVELVSAGAVIQPDVIVYWAAGNPALTNRVPDSPILLGSFGQGALALPDQAARMDGVLLLYSLADGEMVDVSKPFRMPSDGDFIR